MDWFCLTLIVTSSPSPFLMVGVGEGNSTDIVTQSLKITDKLPKNEASIPMEEQVWSSVEVSLAPSGEVISA